MAPEVSILLSTFNGSAYLADQLDSLIAQDYPNLTIHVRDDGSTDGTRRILRAYADAYPNVRLSFGDRVGVTQSFFSLLGNAGSASEYFAFCDQDDVWFPNKIARAVSRLAGVDLNTPALYCSRLEYVDAQLNHIKYSRIPSRRLSFSSALAENNASGCTIVMNRAARNLIARYQPRNCIMHDWWCYLVVAGVGSIIYDESPGLKYRLHGANVTGAAASWWNDVSRRIGRFMSSRSEAFGIHAQAQELIALYGDQLSEEDLRLLNDFLTSKQSPATRLRYALQPGIFRQSRVDDLMLRALIVAGWY
jgi:glycosyltransferase involved in cell wall biosynthesis